MGTFSTHGNKKNNAYKIFGGKACRKHCQGYVSEDNIKSDFEKVERVVMDLFRVASISGLL
jgi:hypothetical protein